MRKKEKQLMLELINREIKKVHGTMKMMCPCTPKTPHYKRLEMLGGMKYELENDLSKYKRG